MATNIEASATELEALRSEIADLDAIAEPTEEQTTRFAAALEEFDAKRAEHDALVERAAKVAAVRDAVIEAPEAVRTESGFHAPNVVVRRDPFENVENIRHGSREDNKARAITAMTEVRSAGTTDAHRESVINLIETVDGAAELALTVGSPSYRSAFGTWLEASNRGQAPIYSPAEAAAVRASLSLTSANGGYALPTLLDPTLIHTGTAVKGNLRDIARVVTGTQNVWNGVTVGNVTTYWKAEASAFTDGSPTTGPAPITAANLTAYVTGSYEVFEDSNLLSQLPGLIGESFGYAESAAFVVGSGSGAPKGIVTAVSGTAGSTVTATTRGQFNTASAVDVFAVLNALPSRYEDNATWVGNKTTFNTIKQMSTGSQGSYFWSDFNAAVGNPLLGSPIFQASSMATAQTSGTKLLVLGDFSQFVIYDRLGTTVEFMQNVVDGSGLPTGQRGLVAHKRVGSDVTDVNAFRIFNT